MKAMDSGEITSNLMIHKNILMLWDNTKKTDIASWEKNALNLFKISGSMALFQEILLFYQNFH